MTVDIHFALTENSVKIFFGKPNFLASFLIAGDIRSLLF